MVRSKLGKRNKLVKSDDAMVIDIKIPKEAVPPKLEAEKIANPKNKMMDV
jgi:hypothetical protein